ncbi:MAG: ribosome-associated translation inhibitor RaiA [Fibromonadaceae bacterium]|jgi:putative sigma-54 modulation protein|nr:ribosome-associated translation inhibitor RaiA [Fibromonadaceae bacterium]
MSNIPFNITVRHLNEPSSKFQNVIQSELSKLENHFHSITEFGVVIEGISKVSNGVELKRKVDITAIVKGNTLVATAEEENFGKAMDSALAKIKVQLSKYHKKASDYRGSPPTSEIAK